MYNTNFEYKDGMFYKNGSPITKQKKKYKTVWYNKKYTYLHRLIYFHHYGVWPKVVDHINGNTEDNRIENLRAADYTVNCNNSKKVTNAKGYWFCKKSKKYVATINDNSKNKILGYFITSDEARSAYRKARSEKMEKLGV